MHRLLLALGVLCGARAAVAQEPPPIAPAAAPAATTTAPATSRRFAVLVLGTNGFTAEKADELTEVLIASVVAHGEARGTRFEVVGKEEFQARLGTDERESQDCISSSECLGRIGVELAVDEVVAGSVGTRPDGGYSVALTRTDIATAASRGRAFRRVEGDERALVEEVQDAADELFAGEAGSAPVAGVETPLTVSESAHSHEKLYLRAGVGGGRLDDSFHAPLGLYKGDATGASVSVEVLAGASLARTVIMGGGIFVEAVQNPTIDVSVGDAGDVKVGTLGALAAVVVWFPFEQFWLQGGLGFASLTIRGSGGDISDHKPAGLALPLGLGYGWWIADEWTLGIGGRVLFAALDDDGIHHSVSAASLMFETTYD